jgi:hypothetical protein
VKDKRDVKAARSSKLPTGFEGFEISIPRILVPFLDIFRKVLSKTPGVNLKPVSLPQGMGIS